MKVFIRSRKDHETDVPFSDPWPVTWIGSNFIPRSGEQIVDRQNDRCFAVQTVEWVYGSKTAPRSQAHNEVHLFCIEYPKEQPPID